MVGVLKFFSRVFLISITCIALFQEMVSDGRFLWGAFGYFTIQSNILAVVYMLFLMVMKKDLGKHGCAFCGTVLICMFSTAITYNFILYNVFFDWGTIGYTFSRTVLHMLTPIGIVLDWIFFSKHGKVQMKDIVLWNIYPFLYGFFSVVFFSFTGKSLYFFLELKNFSYLLLVAAFFIFSSYLFIVMDNFLFRLKTRCNAL